MSIGNPKKFEKLSKLKNTMKLGESETGNDVAKVYKDQNYEVKKALKFKTDKGQSKLA